MSKALQISNTQQPSMLNEVISDILKASLVGVLAVVISAVPFEQSIAQFGDVYYQEFRGGMPPLYLLPLFFIYAAIALVFAKMFAITQLRSLVYNLVTLPFIIFWNSSKKSLLLYLALILIIQYPLLGDGLAYLWPARYRLADGLVLALQLCIMSWLYETLLREGTK